MKILLFGFAILLSISFTFAQVKKLEDNFKLLPLKPMPSYLLPQLKYYDITKIDFDNKGIVVILPLDNMPCFVPNTAIVEKINMPKLNFPTNNIPNPLFKDMKTTFTLP